MSKASDNLICRSLAPTSPGVLESGVRPHSTGQLLHLFALFMVVDSAFWFRTAQEDVGIADRGPQNAEVLCERENAVGGTRERFL